MGEKIKRKALLILSCVLMLEAVGIRHVPNFQRVGLILYAAGMLAMYAMTLHRKIKGLAVNENDFMPFLFGAGLLAIEVRRYAFGEEGKLWLWIIIISLLLALPMLLAERRVPSGKAGNNKYWMRAITIVFLIVLSCFNWVYATNVAFDTSAGTATTGVITRKRVEKGTKHRMSYYLEVSKPLTNETNTFSVSKSDYNRYDEQRVVTVTEHPGFWGRTVLRGRTAEAAKGELTCPKTTNPPSKAPSPRNPWFMPRGDFWRRRWWRTSSRRWKPSRWCCTRSG